MAVSVKGWVGCVCVCCSGTYSIILLWCGEERTLARNLVQYYFIVHRHVNIASEVCGHIRVEHTMEFREFIFCFFSSPYLSLA